MRVVSAPGKVLITGGYLVLDRSDAGIILSTTACFYAIVKLIYDEIKPDSWAWWIEMVFDQIGEMIVKSLLSTRGLPTNTLLFACFEHRDWMIWVKIISTLKSLIMIFLEIITKFQQLREGVHNFFVIFIEVLRDRPPRHDWEFEQGVTHGNYLFGMLQVACIQSRRVAAMSVAARVSQEMAKWRLNLAINMS